jgi:hypothetical protein
MSNEQYKELYQMLDSMDLIEYGSVIEGQIIRKFLGIEYPAVASKKEFDQLSLAELAAIDYVRNILLGQGMYLSQQNGDYRILLPSENVRQVELYISSADKKLNRALKLSRNSPRSPNKPNDQTEARILMKKDGMRRATNFQG